MDVRWSATTWFTFKLMSCSNARSLAVNLYSFGGIINTCWVMTLSESRIVSRSAGAYCNAIWLNCSRSSLSARFCLYSRIQHNAAIIRKLIMQAIMIFTFFFILSQLDVSVFRNGIEARAFFDSLPWIDHSIVVLVWRDVSMSHDFGIRISLSQLLQQLS